MNKFWTIFKREYLTRVKTKGFILGTLLTPLFIVLLSLGPRLLVNIKTEKSKHIAVVDLSGIVYEDLIKLMSDTTKAGKRLYRFDRVEASVQELDTIKEMLNQKVKENKINAYLIIPPDILEKNEFEYYAKSVSNFSENSRMRNSVTQIVTNYRLKESHLDPSLIKQLTQHAKIKTYKITRGGEEKVDSGLSFIITFIMLLFLYMSLIMYGAFVMRSVYEEKLSRVVEVILSSCRPFQLMAGKVLGLGAVGLTQYLIWATVAGLLTLYSSTIMKAFTGTTADVTIPTIPISVLVYFVVYFVLGYLLYATLYAALGAMVNTDQDAQQFQFPVVLLIMISFFLSFHIIKNPNSDLSIIVSLIPFFSPITMFTRIAVQMPPLSEILLSLTLLLGTIVFFIWLAGKIFRVGILMYGKRPTLPEVMRWLKY